MKRPSIFGLLFLLSVTSLFHFSQRAEAACRNPNLVINSNPSFLRVAAAGFVEIQWFGHSFFQITSGSGTRIITDPFYPMGFPMPEVWPHVVTVGREFRNHNNVGLAKGTPLVLRGLKPGDSDWNDIHVNFRDVLIYNVPVHQRGYLGYQRSIRGAAFVFEMDGMCILHCGDVSEPFNEDQLQFIGHIDVLLVPIGGRFTAGPEGAKEIIATLRPKIVVPMHYYSDTTALERFLDGPYQARLLETNKFSVSKYTLPPVTEIFIPKVIWSGRVDDY